MLDLLEQVCMCHAACEATPCVFVSTEIMTCLDSINDDGRQRSIQKPKMIVELTKSEQFDQIIAEQEREAAAAKAADANGAAA